MTLSSNCEKVKVFTTSLIKSTSYQFLSLIDLKGIKKYIIASAKIFWPGRPGRLQSGREHFFGLDCGCDSFDRNNLMKMFKKKTQPNQTMKIFSCHQNNDKTKLGKDWIAIE